MTIEKMSVFNEQSFEKKLTALKDSQESIQSLSTWCLQHRQHHKNIVTSWHKVLKKVKLDHRLTLFYLANDVIQYSKRRNYEFVESWGTALQRATTMVRDQKVKEKILRIFKIWGERGIYDETFITDLCGLMSTTTRKKPVESEPVAEPAAAVVDPLDFHSSDLFAKVRSCHRLEDDTDLRLKRLNESHKVFTDADALRSHLKDRRQGEDVVAEVEEGGKMMEAYMAALEAEIKERKQLIEELDLAEKFYETQQGDAKLVVSAYKNFGNRVRNLKRHLDERMTSYACPSPIPSPDVNAPSPSPDLDIELPELPGLGDGSQPGADSCFTSFLGNSALPFDFQKNLFSDAFEEQSESGEGKPIEVINSRTEAEMEFSINNFLKTLGNLASGTTTQANQPPPYQTPTNQTTYASTVPANQTTYASSVPAIQTTYASSVPANQTTFASSVPINQTTYASSVPANQTTYAAATVATNAEPYVQVTANEALYGSQVSANPSYSTQPPRRYSSKGQETQVPYNNVNQYAAPLPPPPPPPDFSGLPSKFPLWEGEVWEETDDCQTPSSPPPNEKQGFSAPPEYDDSRPDPACADVDARLLHIPLPDVDHRSVVVSAKDVDHRNLISLTGSPGPPPPPPPPALAWAADRDYRATDVDYRAESRDNVESVDMELSDDEAPVQLPSLLRMPLVPPPGLHKLHADVQPTDKMENGCVEDANINGRSRLPLLNTPPPPEDIEHWQDDDVPLFHDWTNNVPPRGRGFPPPRSRGPMRGRPMRRPYGPRPFRPLFMARPGSYGSW